MSYVAFFSGVFAYKLFCCVLCGVLERDLVYIDVEQTVDPTAMFLQVRKFKTSELQLVVVLSSNHKLDGS